MIGQVCVPILSLRVKVGVQWGDQHLAMAEALCRSAGAGHRPLTKPPSTALGQDPCQDRENPRPLNVKPPTQPPTPSLRIWADRHGSQQHCQLLLVISVMLRGPVFPDTQRLKTIAPDCVHRREPLTATTTVSPYLLFAFTENEKKMLKPLVRLACWSGVESGIIYHAVDFAFFPSLGPYRIE